MDHLFVQVLMRYIHIVSAIALVGGTSFVAIAMLPAMRLLEDNLRASVQKLAMDRFIRVIWIGIAGLIFSGAYNWVLLMPSYDAIRPVGHILIGIKALLALVLFLVVWANRIGLIKLSVRAYLMINLHLAAIVILLGAILRTLRAVA